MNVSDPAAVAERLRLVRHLHGLSQAKFAQKADVSPSAYANWEQGRQRPRLSDAEKIANAFDLTLDYIFLGKTFSLRHEVAKAIEDFATSRA